MGKKFFRVPIPQYGGFDFEKHRLMVIAEFTKTGKVKYMEIITKEK